MLFTLAAEFLFEKKFDFRIPRYAGGNNAVRAGGTNNQCMYIHILAVL